MEEFEYFVLTSSESLPQTTGPIWVGTEGINFVTFGANLPAVLNSLGKQGWEVICATDTRGTARAEIILKRKIPKTKKVKPGVV